MPTWRPCARNCGCSLRKETVIADQVEGFIEDRLVIAAVVFQRCEVLVDDLVVVGERIGRDEMRRLISARSSPSCARGDVQQPLDDENAMLAPGASVRRDDRLLVKTEVKVLS